MTNRGSWEWVDVDCNIVSISFRRILNLFAFATQRSLSVYRIQPFEKVYSEDISGVSHVDMISQERVGVMIDNILHIYDLSKRKLIGDLKINSFRLKTLRFLTVPKQVAFVGESKVDLYRFRDLVKPFKESENIEITLTFMHSGTILTHENPDGVVAICDFDPMLGIPGKEVGTLRIVKIDSNKSILIRAHDNPLQCISFSDNGKIVVTAASRGRVLRVFDTVTGKLKKEVKRGSTRTKILSISVSYDNEFFTCFGRGGTMHVFRLKDSHLTTTEKITGERSILRCSMLDEISTTGNGIVTFSRNHNFIIYFLNIDSSIFYQIMCDFQNSMEKKFRKGYVIDKTRYPHFEPGKFPDPASKQQLVRLSQKIERKVHTTLKENFDFDVIIGQSVKEICQESRLKEKNTMNNIYLQKERDTWRKEKGYYLEFLVQELMTNVGPLLSSSMLSLIEKNIVSEELLERMAHDLVDEIIKNRFKDIKMQIKKEVRRIITSKLLYIRRNSRKVVSRRKVVKKKPPPPPPRFSRTIEQKKEDLTNQLLAIHLQANMKGSSGDEDSSSSSTSSDDEDGSNEEEGEEGEEEVGEDSGEGKYNEEEEGEEDVDEDQFGDLEEEEKQKKKLKLENQNMENFKGYMEFVEAVKKKDGEKKIGVILKPDYKQVRNTSKGSNKNLTEEEILKNNPFLMLLLDTDTSGTILKFQVSRALGKAVDDWSAVKIHVPISEILQKSIEVKSNNKVGEFKMHKSRDSVLYLKYVFEDPYSSTPQKKKK